MAWTEIGLEADDYLKIAERLLARQVSRAEIQRVCVRDVCGSFAFDTFRIFPCMLWMIMPIWGYSEGYLRERIRKWHSQPIWVHLLNRNNGVHGTMGVRNNGGQTPID